MKSYTRAEMIRFLTTTFSVLVLACGCVLSTLLLYGGGSLQTAARMEASSLAAIEVNELVGTNDYERSDHYVHHNLLTAMTQTFGLPFLHPLSMLDAEFPKTEIPVQSTDTSASQTSLYNAVSTWESKTKKIALGWIQSGTASTCIRLLQENPGINVVSPDWMQVEADGTVKNDSISSVIRYAHDHGIQVWPMFTNQFSRNLTHRVLSNSDARHRMIDQLVQSANHDHLDGINVDFENIDSGDESLFTEFIQELHSALQENHILLSADITPDIVALQDTDAYFHAALAGACDYLIVMAYDEHWSTDKTPGPVADVPWVSNSINDLLNTGVPADKLILGMPFYTYVWHIYPDGSVVSLPTANSDVTSILDYHQVKGKWVDDLGVAYAKYKKPDCDAEVWYETDETIARKLSLVSEDGLAGVGIWSLNWSDQHSWSTVIQSLRQSLS